MRLRQGILLIAGLVALCVVAAALAARGDPRLRLKAADQRYALFVLPRKADLPGTGWRVARADFSEPNPDCLVNHFSQSSLTATGLAGLDFAQQRRLLLSSTAIVYSTRPQAATAVAINSSLGLARCLGTSFVQTVNESVPHGTSARLARIEQVTLPGLPLRATGFRFVVRVRRVLASQTVAVLSISMRYRRAVVSLSGPDIPVPVLRALATKTANRMKARLI
jgi:hypothetical protein